MLQELIMIDGLLSLIFFAIEFAILIMVVLLNRDHPYFWTTISLLALLQLYQLSEFLICSGIAPAIFIRIGYVIITFLPPTGYFLSSQISGWKNKSNILGKDYILGFILGLGFAIYYLVDTASVTLLDCNPFYATYDSKYSLAYGIFYYGYIMFGIALLFYSIGFGIYKEQNYPNKKYAILILIGYLSFLVPMHLMTLIDVSWLKVVPSVMCKYAILLAISLGIFSFIKKTKTE